MRKLPVGVGDRIRDVYMMPLEQEAPLLPLEFYFSWQCRNLIIKGLEEALSEKKRR